MKTAKRKLSVGMETLRTLTSVDLAEVAGGTAAAPPQSRSSTAPSRQTTRFGCC